MGFSGKLIAAFSFPLYEFVSVHKMLDRMRGLANLVFVAFCLLGEATALGCSCDPRNGASVETAYESANNVVLAEIVHVEDVELRPPPLDLDPVPGERVTLRVITSWKGGKQPGDLVIVENLRSKFSCDKNTSNDPPWVETSGGDGNLVPDSPRAWAVWLIYATGDQPWRFSRCGRSMPLEFDAAKLDVKRLDKLLSRKKKSVR